MTDLDLIKILPDGEKLGKIAWCLLSPTGSVYYSIRPCMMDFSVFVKKLNLLDEYDDYSWDTYQKNRKYPTHYDFLINKGYAYLWVGETVQIYPGADTMKHCWHYKDELLTEVQKAKIQELTGEFLPAQQCVELSPDIESWRERHGIGFDYEGSMYNVHRLFL